MSVIVEHPVLDANGRLVFAGGPIFLYCKGADSAILARTLPPSNAVEGQQNSFSKQQLMMWGNDGLRTLAFGSRELVRADYESWNREYHGLSPHHHQPQLQRQYSTHSLLYVSLYPSCSCMR